MGNEDAIFLALIAATCAWLAQCFFLLVWIKNRHASLFEMLGSPSMTSISPEILIHGADLLFGGRHKNAGDSVLTTLVYSLRVTGLVIAALLMLFIYALVTVAKFGG